MMMWLVVCLLIATSVASSEVCTDPVCEFEFIVRRTQTMTTTIDGQVFSVQLKETRLQVVKNSFRRVADYPDIIGRTVDPDDVITADGYPRDVIVVNDQFPGPTLEVTEGVQVSSLCRY